jgi:hypothetical protein
MTIEQSRVPNEEDIALEEAQYRERFHANEGK